MKYFCTIADKNFSSRVLALNESLKKYNKDYTLLTLCIDEGMSFHEDNILNFDLSTLLQEDENLYIAKNNKPSEEALRVANGDYDKAKSLQFTWLLSPYFSDYCLNLDMVKDDLLYIDSDIYFFDNWTKIYNSITSNINIGLVEHRMPWTGNSGKYNVGIIYFKKNNISKDCASFWKNCLLNTNNQYYSEYGQCGDQKYLELFPKLFEGVYSLDNFFGHLAPWNLPYHEYTDTQILWNNQLQDIMYYHFSNFKIVDESFIPAPRHGIGDVSSVPILQMMHQKYYEVLQSYA